MGKSIRKIMTMLDEKAIKGWYNQRHRFYGENAWRPYEAYPIFLDSLRVTSGRRKRLLDVGCGTGYLLKAAEQRGLETYGVDISEDGVKIAEKVSPNSEIIVGKGEDLRLPESFFDYVTCVGALEHFRDMEKGIKEMVRIAKKGALFCIVVPNSNYLFGRIRGTQGTEQRDINENLLSLRQWKAVFWNGGLEVLRIYQDKWSIKRINVLSWTNPLQVLKAMIHKLAWICLPLNFTNQFVFILRKG